MSPDGRDDPEPCRRSTDGDGSEPLASLHSVDGRRSVPQATAWSPLSGDGDGAASTATDQRRRRRLRAIPPQRRRPQLSAAGDGSEPSQRRRRRRGALPPQAHSVDGHTAGTDQLGRRRLRALPPQRRQRPALSGPPAAASCHATKQPDSEYYYGIAVRRRAQPLELCARESLRFLAVHQPCRHRSFTHLARVPRSPAHNTPSPCPLVFGSGNSCFSVSGWH